jgi:hypothetical protein
MLLVPAFTVLAASACGERAQTAFILKAGTMESSSPGIDRRHETQRITMDPTRRPGWCFLVDPSDYETYEVYSVTYLPGQPKELTRDFAGQSESSAGLRSATSRVDGVRPFCFDFHHGDPLGEYRVEVFINGARHTELRMHVVE